jgi:poly-gamma-glutamate synthesis protein (capsule biosynthesis protein)
VPRADLRKLELAYIGFDGRAHAGVLIVHADVADDVVQVFHELFDARWPIERMEPVDAYDGDDDRSMAANNTSAFNCRTVAGSSRWSEHAFGRAIDINPIQNPYVDGDQVDPPAGAAFVDRASDAPGVITADGPVVAAFARIGWGWGGAWSSAKDYQHFSATGR